MQFDGPLAAPPGVAVAVDVDGDVHRWAVTNDSDRPVTLDRVGLRWRLARPPERMFRNGYQSWSPSGGGPFPDGPIPAAPGLVRAMYHADATPAPAGETRSELVTALDLGADGAVVLGFDGGDRHDGTFRVTGAAVVAEAYLGGTELQPGERRELHAVRVREGDVHDGLDEWAGWAGAASGARRAAPFQVGWCSWYHYFAAVTEADVSTNLRAAGDWPLDVFVVDDGYQAAIGDWLVTNDRFPSGLGALAASIASTGLTPGLWLAPFLASPSSAVASTHPEWLVRRRSGRPAVGMVNPAWGGEVHVLDTTRPDVLAHLEAVASSLAAMGWRYLKLDFTYAPSFDAQWHDPSATPAQRVRTAYEAIRSGAGDDTFLLGCGAPLGPCIGAVDGMRIGPDVAPAWEPRRAVEGYEDAAPATANAWRNTLARSFMHRRLWLNDPDCVMLRTTDTALTPDQVEAWAMAVAVSGGMVMVSDDLSRLGDGAHALLGRVLEIATSIDDRAVSGPSPRCPDLLDRWTPTTLQAGDLLFVGDPAHGTAHLRPRGRQP